MIASEEAISKHSLTPLARLVGYSVAGVDPTIMGIGPIYAIRDLLQKANLSLDNIDLVEVHDNTCGLWKLPEYISQLLHLVAVL